MSSFKKSIVTLYVLSLSLLTLAQTGQEFWFVAPDVIEDHGDSPIVFRVTALDEAATVIMTMPANPSFTEQVLTLSAYEQGKFSFSDRDDLDMIENFDADEINSKGILIISDADVNVYYEVANTSNPDKFTLKGENALGTEFYVSSQTDYQNKTGKYNDDPPYEQINIVATTDDTEVLITPTNDVEGHTANVTYSITLNRGETYCIKGTSRAASYNLGGTHIVSNEKIAVTISDDSIVEDTASWDLVGDQTIPVDQLGTEYIAVFTGEDYDSTDLNLPIQKVYVMATVDNTSVAVNFDETTTSNVTLDAGETYSYDIEEEGSVYIQTSDNVYVYQVVGYLKSSNNSNEMGSAILPPITCTGSTSVCFTRILTYNFYVQILCQYKNLNYFTLTDSNGDETDYLDDIDWIKVPQTGDEGDDETWYSSNTKLENLSTNDPQTLTNSNGLFHLSVFDLNNGSASYGYFSEFNSLDVEAIGDECKGEAIELAASESLGSYTWYSEATQDEILSTDSILTVYTDGTYWVTATRYIDNVAACQLSDTVVVEFEDIELSLGNDIEVCSESGYVVSATYSDEDDDSDYYDYLWFDGSTDSIYTITQTGPDTLDVWLTITTFDGCSFTDSIQVIVFEETDIEFNFDTDTTNLCYGATLSNVTDLSNYEWRFDDPVGAVISTESYITVDVTGWYYLSATDDNGCSGTDSVYVEIYDLPIITLSDETLCHDATYTSPDFSSSYSYIWSSVFSGLASTATQVSLTATDSLYVIATDVTTGCTASDSAFIEFLDETIIDSTETTICAYTDVDLTADNLILSDYVWTFGNDTLSTGSSTLSLTNVLSSEAGTYVVSGIDADGCSVEQKFILYVTLGSSIDLGLDKSICEGSSVELSIDVSAAAYEWYYNENPETVDGATIVSSLSVYEVDTEGMYYVKAMSSGGCESVDSVYVTVNDLPDIDLDDVSGLCQGTSYVYDAGSGYEYIWQDGSSNQTYTAYDPEEVSVTITDSNGCSNADTTTFEWKEVGIFSSEYVTVCPVDDYTITTGSTLTDITWYYNDGTTTIELSGSSDSYTITDVELADAGDYIVNATEDGCDVWDTLTLYVVDVGSINLGDDRTICEGETIELNASDGFDTYKWYFNNDLSYVYSTESSVTAGNVDDDPTSTSETWYLYVEHSSGCTLEDWVVVNKVYNPFIDLIDSIRPCSYDTVEVAALINYVYSNSSDDPTSDNSGVTYYWDDDTNATAIEDMLISVSGDYTVTVSNYHIDTAGDSTFCYASDSTNVLYWDELELTKLSDVYICPGTTTTLEAPSEVTSYSDLQSYQWSYLDSNNDVISSNTENTSWTSVSDLGTYSLYVLYTDSLCVASDTLDLFNYEAPDVSILGDTIVCEGESSILYSNSIFANYLWSTGESTESISADTAGDYTLTVTSSSTGCDATDTTSFVVNELPIIALSDTITGFCYQSSTDLFVSSVTYSDGSSALSPVYEWNTWETTSSIKVDDAGTYSVEVTDSNGCSNTEEAEVSAYDEIIIDFDNIDTDACPDIGVYLECPFDTDTITSFQWTKSGGSSSTPAINTNWTVFESGIYILNVIDANLCEAYDSVEVEILAAPEIDLGENDTICSGESIEISNEDDYSAYVWSTGSVESAITVSTVGTSDYWVEVTDENGCTNSDTITVTSLSLPTVSIADPGITCSGTEVELIPTVTSSTASYSLWWSTNTSASSISVNGGTYSVTVTDDNGCTGTGEITVTQYDAPTVSLGNDTILCPSIDTMYISPNEGDIFESYLWHNDLTDYEIVASIGAVNSVKVTDSNGCSGFDQVKITYYTYTDTTFNFALCQQDTLVNIIDIDNDADEHTGEYYWFHDGSTESYNTFSSSDTFRVSIGITLDDGLTTCYYKIDTLAFEMYSLPVIETLDTLVYGEVSIEMNGENSPYEYSLDSIIWQDSNEFTDLDEGDYTVYVLDCNGCSTSQVFSITADVDLTIANYFTPNNDGYNDTWEIDGISSFPESEIRIYDRYGKLMKLYYGDDEGWDGTYYNKPVKETDYWYVIKIVPLGKVIKGHFTLKR
jgi:gliding motility-associated-like protein